MPLRWWCSLLVVHCSLTLFTCFLGRRSAGVRVRQSQSLRVRVLATRRVRTLQSNAPMDLENHLSVRCNQKFSARFPLPVVLLQAPNLAKRNLVDFSEHMLRHHRNRGERFPLALLAHTPSFREVFLPTTAQDSRYFLTLGDTSRGQIPSFLMRSLARFGPHTLTTTEISSVPNCSGRCSTQKCRKKKTTKHERSIKNPPFSSFFFGGFFLALPDQFAAAAAGWCPFFCLCLASLVRTQLSHTRPGPSSGRDFFLLHLRSLQQNFTAICE